MSDLDLAPPPAPPTDGLLTIEARVLAVDAADERVMVSVRGSSIWVPAVAGRYATASELAPSRAVVLLDPAQGQPVRVLGPLTVRPPVVPATLTALVGLSATVTLDGAPYVIPYMSASYGTLPRAVWVALDDWGRPALVMGTSTAADSSAPPPDPGGGGGGTVQVTTTIVPQWSGSWRSDRAAWDRWNTDRYGGRSTLYQGNGSGSGPMKGLATYGDQLVNLGAISIDRIQVAIRSVGLASGSPAVTVQGSPHGSQPAGAPSSSGDTASGMDGLVDLSAPLREAMRVGLVKGLATVGSAYSAAAGAGSGDGMALTVTYTRPA